MTADLYAVLGVSPLATARDIKRAYRRRARELHPDHNLDDPVGAAERFKALGAAYEVLGDPARRATYDAKRMAPASLAPTWVPTKRRRTQPQPHVGNTRRKRRRREDPRVFWGDPRTGDGVYPDEGSFGPDPANGPGWADDYAAEGGVVDIDDDEEILAAIADELAWRSR